MVMREAELMYGGNSDASYDDIYGAGTPDDTVPVDTPDTANAIDETVDVAAVKSLVKQLGAVLGLTVTDPAEEPLNDETTEEESFDDLGAGYPEA